MASTIKEQLGKLNTIVTHKRPDMDACLSSFLLVLASGKKDARFIFLPPGMGGESRPEEGWFVVDTGKGMFDHHQETSTHLSATEAVWEWLRDVFDEDISWCLKLFIELANLQDTGRSRHLYCSDSFRSAVGDAFSTTALLQAMTRYGSYTDEEIMREMLSVFALLLERKLGHSEVRRTLSDKEVWLDESGMVVLVKDTDARYSKAEEKKGRSIVVFSTKSGSIGVTRTRHGAQIDLGRFAKSDAFNNLFEQNSNERDQWHVQRDGHAISRSMQGSYAWRGDSTIKPLDLAKAVAAWIKWE